MGSHTFCIDPDAPSLLTKPFLCPDISELNQEPSAVFDRPVPHGMGPLALYPPLPHRERLNSSNAHSVTFLANTDPMIYPLQQPYTNNEDDAESAFLMRRFSEGPASWMDIFDSGAYFAEHVPVKARHSALLRSSAVACAAKSLIHRRVCKLSTECGSPTEGWSEMHPALQSATWQRKAVEHYNTAVSLLLKAMKRQSVQGPYKTADMSSPRTIAAEVICGKKLLAMQSVSDEANGDLSIEDLLLASALLCVYESLDATLPEWSKHLSGVRSLLGLQHRRHDSLQLSDANIMTSPADSYLVSGAQKATFWIMVRQDMLAACT